MTNDELIRQVATEIKRNHHSGTMEEAIDAAKAALAITERRYERYKAFVDFRMMVVTALLDWPNDDGLTFEQMMQSVASLNMKYHAFMDGEDYTLLSTEPQIVTEIIEPEAKG